MWSLDAGGGGDERPVSGSLTGDIPVAIAPDGDTLAVLRSVGGGDIYAVSLSAAWPARPLVTSPGYDGGADFSPDGRWMVYASTDSGPSQVYLTPFPQADRKWSVSTRGGTQPRFGRSGRQIFYRDEARLMAVDVEFMGDDVRLSSHGCCSRRLLPLEHS
jgi:Tol biopolymer transport system component